MAQLKDLLVTGASRFLNSIYGDLNGNVLNYGECSSTLGIQDKTVTVNGIFELITGSEVAIKFINGNSASSPTLNVNGTGAKPIYVNGTNVPAPSATEPTYIKPNTIYNFRYNGTAWEMVGSPIGGSNSSAKFLDLYEPRGTTSTLNKAANYVGAGKLFHLIASSNTSSSENGKPPLGDANVLQMNWDNNGGYDVQLAISTSGNRMEFRDRVSTKNSWREVVTSTPGSTSGNNTNPIYISSSGISTPLTYTKNRLYYSASTSSFEPTGHYASTSKVAINTVSEPDYIFYVNGTSYFNGVVSLANNTLNKIGDDILLGDINTAGHLGIKGANGNTGIIFTTYNSTSNTTGGRITWDGSKFILTGNSSTLSTSMINSIANGTFQITSHNVYWNFDNTYGLRIGPNDNTHIDLGYDGIQAKNANSSAASTLYLQYNGGNIQHGKSGSNSNLTNWGNIYPGSTNTYDLGSSSLKWKNIYFNGSIRKTDRIYPYIGSQERSQWYKITFPYYTATTSTASAKWFMNSFDLHVGGGYNANATGVMHIAFYWMRNKENGTWTVSQASAHAEGPYMEKVTLYYRIAEPGILYINNSSNGYNGIWIDNLYTDDTGSSLDWATTTFATCSAITVSNYTVIPTSRITNQNNKNLYFFENTTKVGQFVDGALSLFPQSNSYREGLRIHSYNSWSDILLCGNDNTIDSGTSANSWFIGNNNGKFWIVKNGSSSSGDYFLNHDGTNWLIKGSFYPSTDIIYDLGNKSYRWKNIYANALELQGPASNPSATAGARIIFSYDDGDNRSQKVYLGYTPNDSYREPMGLKLWGDSAATWLELDSYRWITNPTREKGAIVITPKTHTELSNNTYYYRPWISGSEGITGAGYGNSWTLGLHAIGVSTASTDRQMDNVGFYLGTAWDNNATTAYVWRFTRAGNTYAPNNITAVNSIATNQTSGNAGVGISLYGGVSHVTTYGILFATTANRGKWGDVQGDWATYFTMSNTPQRGWAWQASTADAGFAGSLSRRGVFTTRSIARAGDSMIIAPDGAYFKDSASKKTGAIKITLPQLWSNTMMRFIVDIYDYSSNNSVSYYIGGYNYSSSSEWVNTFAYSEGIGDKSNLTVRFGHDGSKTCVTIGETNTVWSYPKVSVRNVIIGHSGDTISNWSAGWNISFITTLPTIQSEKSNTNKVISGTASRIAYYNTINSVTSGSINTDGSYLSNISYLTINEGSQTTHRLKVNGTSYFNGDTTHNGIIYFANGTTYFINNSAKGYLSDLFVDKIRLDGDTIAFHSQVNNTSTATRLGYIQTDGYYMYFRKENGNSGFNFNGHIIPNTTQSNTFDLGTSSATWRNVYTKRINQAITGGTRTTAGGDKGASANPRYFPDIWTFNAGITPANGDMITIETPGPGHDYGVFLSVNNGTNYYPIVLSGTGRLTTHYGVGSFITLIFDSDQSAASMFALAGQNNTTRITVSGGCWRVINYYDSGNPGDWNLRQYTIKAAAAVRVGHVIGALDATGYKEIDGGNAFDIRYAVLWVGTAISSGSTNSNNFIHHYAVNIKNSGNSNISLTAYKNVYIKGTLNGTVFTPISGGNPYVLDIPTTDDGYSYYYIGRAYNGSAMTFDTTGQKIYDYRNAKTQIRAGNVIQDLTSTTIGTAPGINADLLGGYWTKTLLDNLNTNVSALQANTSTMQTNISTIQNSMSQSWISGKDLNTCLTSGLYWISTNITNAPNNQTSLWAGLLVIGRTDCARQVLYQDANTIWYRTYQNSSWSEWRRMGFYPYHCDVYYATGTPADVSFNSKIIFNNVRVNLGNCYNTTTGEFTAPIKGLYNISFGFYSNNSSTTQRSAIMINGTMRSMVNGACGHTHCTTLLLNAGDKVTAGAYASNFPISLYAGAGHNYFTCTLLQAW